jgi:hypothetical protein
MTVKLVERLVTGLGTLGDADVVGAFSVGLVLPPPPPQALRAATLATARLIKFNLKWRVKCFMRGSNRG